MNDMAREKGDMYAAFVTQELGQGIVSLSCLCERGLMLRTELRDLLSGKAVYEPDENLDNGTGDYEDRPLNASRRRKSGTKEPTGTKKKSSQKGSKPETDTITNEKNNSNMQAGQKVRVRVGKKKNIQVIDPVEENNSKMWAGRKEPPVEDSNYNPDPELPVTSLQNDMANPLSDVSMPPLHSDGMIK
jgi:hypothetical protein